MDMMRDLMRDLEAVIDYVVSECDFCLGGLFWV